MIYIDKNDTIDYRTYLIMNKIIEINNCVKSLEDQIKDSMMDYLLIDEDVLNNNLSLMKSLIIHYKGQKKILISILGDYCSIMSNKNKREKEIFLKIWSEQTDLILSKKFSFDFSYTDSNDSLDEIEQKKLVKM